MTGGLERAIVVALAIFAWAGPALAADGGTERCNGRDDDGDGAIDEDFPLGEACRAPPVAELAQDSLGVGECRDGRWRCDFSGWDAVCAGGVGPKLETCDGLDNDCDGVVDDQGDTWPRGLANTSDPANPRRYFGAPCGGQFPPCHSAWWRCVDGKGACVGGVQPKPEICDGIDNDCNGRPDDEPIPADGALPTPLCPADRTCLDTQFGFQCGGRCAASADCDGGKACTPFFYDDGGSQGYCVLDRCASCGSAVVVAPDGGTVCAPYESALGGLLVPECACRGQEAGCGSPCEQSCPIGTRCIGLEKRAGCVPETNCYYFGCFSGQACHERKCVDDPCSPNPCRPSEVCRPGDDFRSHQCVSSCAGVSCGPGQRCKDGACVETGCATACETPLVCRGDRGCVPSSCPKNGRCSDGEFCEPETGRCTDAPCEAVVCPAGQQCENGQCSGPPFPDPRDAAAPADAGPRVDASVTPDAGSTQADAGRPADPPPAPASPESSCGCRAAGERTDGAWWLVALLALAVIRGRSKRRSVAEF